MNKLTLSKRKITDKIIATMTFVSHLTYKSAWYLFPFSIPSKVGIWLFLKLSVESYTAVTTEETN